MRVKRYASAAAIVAAVIALLFHPSHAQHAFIQSDASPASFPKPHTHLVATQIVVYVAGAVRKPGLYHLAAGSRGVDGVSAAGGLTAQADPSGVNLAEQLEDGEQITAPLRGERISRRVSHPHRRKHKRRQRNSNSAVAIAPVDLNSADAQALTQLPGIGDELARRIIAFRAANGPFASLDELADVAGVTPRLIDSLLPYLTIGR